MKRHRKSRNVKGIVSDWLEDNGYSGLCNTDLDCGCLLGDFAPCCLMDQEHCEAAYNFPAIAKARGLPFWMSTARPVDQKDKDERK